MHGWFIARAQNIHWKAWSYKTKIKIFQYFYHLSGTYIIIILNKPQKNEKINYKKTPEVSSFENFFSELELTLKILKTTAKQDLKKMWENKSSTGSLTDMADDVSVESLKLPECIEILFNSLRNVER